MNEHEIVQLMRAKDEQGAQEFLRHYGALVRYVAEPVLEDPGACEDCLQEVVHRVWERIESFSEGRGSFKAWITAITRNLALNMKRSQRQAQSYEELDTELADPGPGPEETAVRNAAAAALKAAVDSLPRDEKLLIYRRFFYNQSLAQIAAETGISERAAEGRIYRIKAKLSEMLKEFRDER